MILLLIQLPTTFSSTPPSYITHSDTDRLNCLDREFNSHGEFVHPSSSCYPTF